MRWPKTPADLLTEKTFLVIRDNLQSIQEKSVEKAAPTDTWPPKMRKKRPRKSGPGPESSATASATTTCESSDSEHEPRPATASLEAPLVLDPRLVDKLDMSLLSKESLNASLTRISLSLARSLEASSPMVNPENSGRASSNQQVMRPRPGRLVCTSPTRTIARPREIEPPSEPAMSPEGSVKRLDDNNNKNKQAQLSPLRSRSSSQRSSIDKKKASPISNIPTAVSTSFALPPEPCKTCGRACLPERLHSHPKSPSSPKDPLIGSARSSPSVIPVRTSSHRSSLRKNSARIEKEQSPRCDSQGNSLASVLESALSVPTTERKMPKDEKKVNSASVANVSLASAKQGEEKTTTVAAKRRPRSVTCYICGREFGTASFPIHEPKCLEKWNRENKLLPVAQRRPEPHRPTVSCDSEEWNAAAWQQSQALLVPCPSCKRTFLPDRLAIHARNCRVK